MTNVLYGAINLSIFRCLLFTDFTQVPNMKTPISSTASENGLIVLIQPVLFVKQGANLAYHSPETIEPKILRFFVRVLN